MILFTDSFDDLVMYYYDDNMDLRCWIGVGEEGVMNAYTNKSLRLSDIRDSFKYRLKEVQVLYDTGDE